MIRRGGRRRFPSFRHGTSASFAEKCRFSAGRCFFCWQLQPRGRINIRETGIPNPHPQGATIVKTVLVTGADGMLGSEVVRLLSRESDVHIIGTTVDQMDITNLGAVRDTMLRHRPTHIIHCAAFTAVDSAEKEPLRAYMVNAEGTKNLAFFARELDAEMIYLSTDYIFSGTKGTPYLEGDTPNPLNTYGKSKLLGERYVQALTEQHKIVRTSWLNGLGGDFTRNFIETMLRLAESRPSLSVVHDQRGRPTFTFDLAQALVMLLNVNSYGIFHVTNSGECTWYEFAVRLFELAGKHVDLQPISSEQFRSLARRPTYSALDNTRFPALGLPKLPAWEDSLREYFRRRRVSMQTGNEEQQAVGPRASMP